MEIFIVVEVHYDYYRFQENLYCSDNRQECFKFIKNKRTNYPVYEYEKYDSLYKELNKHKEDHYQIEKFIIEKESEKD